MFTQIPDEILMSIKVSKMIEKKMLEDHALEMWKKLQIENVI